jgi:uncharacterized membrane protein
MSNFNNLLSDNSKTFKGAAFHYKFSAIILIIIGALMALLGIPAILLFGLGLIYIAFGGLYIYLGILLLNASKPLKALSKNPDSTQEDFNAGVVKSIDQSRKFYKITNILTVVSLVLGIIGGIVIGVMFASLINNPDVQKGFMMQDSKNPGMNYTLPAISSKNTLNTSSKAPTTGGNFNKNGSFNISTPEGNMIMDENGNFKIQSPDGKDLMNGSVPVDETTGLNQ